MKKILQRGFTLIELLVVIAIIGILAAVVLASLNDARDGGRDASVKGSMNSIRNQMELLYNNNNFEYDGLCAHADLDDLRNSVVDNSPANSFATTDATAGSASVAVCHDTNEAWVAATPLNAEVSAGNPWYFCVDSTGKATTTGTAVVAYAASPEVGIACP